MKKRLGDGYWYDDAEKLWSHGDVDVYKAGRRDGGEELVCKVVGNGEYAIREKAAFLAIAEREHVEGARHLVTLKHQEIVEVDGGYRGYFVMERLGDSVLDAHAGEDAGALVADVIRSGIDALEFLDRAGIYHRDIHPGNLLRPGPGRDDGIVLIDFGHSLTTRSGDQAVHTDNTLRGVMALQSPEVQNNRGHVGLGDDLFSLGQVAYLLLDETRNLPWMKNGQHIALLSGEWGAFREEADLYSNVLEERGYSWQIDEARLIAVNRDVAKAVRLLLRPTRVDRIKALPRIKELVGLPPATTRDDKPGGRIGTAPLPPLSRGPTPGAKEEEFLREVVAPIGEFRAQPDARRRAVARAVVAAAVVPLATLLAILSVGGVADVAAWSGTTAVILVFCAAVTAVIAGGVASRRWSRSRSPLHPAPSMSLGLRLGLWTGVESSATLLVVPCLVLAVLRAFSYAFLPGVDWPPSGLELPVAASLVAFSAAADLAIVGVWRRTRVGAAVRSGATPGRGRLRRRALVVALAVVGAAVLVPTSFVGDLWSGDPVQCGKDAVAFDHPTALACLPHDDEWAVLSTTALANDPSVAAVTGVPVGSGPTGPAAARQASPVTRVALRWRQEPCGLVTVVVRDSGTPGDEFEVTMPGDPNPTTMSRLDQEGTTQRVRLGPNYLSARNYFVYDSPDAALTAYVPFTTGWGQRFGGSTPAAAMGTTHVTAFSDLRACGPAARTSLEAPVRDLIASLRVSDPPWVDRSAFDVAPGPESAAFVRSIRLPQPGGIQTREFSPGTHAGDPGISQFAQTLQCGGGSCLAVRFDATTPPAGFAAGQADERTASVVQDGADGRSRDYWMEFVRGDVHVYVSAVLRWDRSAPTGTTEARFADMIRGLSVDDFQRVG